VVFCRKVQLEGENYGRLISLWTFVHVEGVEPTNNAAERAIRPVVLWRKGSFGTQSAAGPRFVEAMMTVVATLKQQHRNVLAYMTDACQASILVSRYHPCSLCTPRCMRNCLPQLICIST
jgi:Transposase IS66 family